jgi:nucleotide-binding universal stress UspA family protein
VRKLHGSSEAARTPILLHVTRSGPLLIGYDGSTEAGHAIGVAAALLKPTEAVVLSVAPRITPGESLVTVASPVSGDAAFEGLNKDDAARRADAGARLARAAGLHADGRVCTASPRWQGIVETANEIDTAVIVLGSKHPLDVSYDVAQHAGRPVLIVPQRARERSDESPILIAFDGSEHARTALQAAHAFIRRREAVILATAANAQTGVDFAQALGLHASARTAAAPSTWRALANVADEIDAGVIVAGVSHDIARHGGRPVLVVPR